MKRRTDGYTQNLRVRVSGTRALPRVDTPSANNEERLDVAAEAIDRETRETTRKVPFVEARQVVELLSQYEKISLSELASQLGMSLEKSKASVGRLQDLQLVTVTEDENGGETVRLAAAHGFAAVVSASSRPSSKTCGASRI